MVNAMIAHTSLITMIWLQPTKIKQIVVWPGHKNFEFWFSKAFLRAVLNFDFEKIFSEQGAFGGGGAANGGGEGVEGEYVEVESDQEENQFK